MPDATSNIVGVGTVIVPVSDQDQALAFYSEKLGFEKRNDTPYGRGDRWLEVAPPGEGSTTIALIPPREGESIGIDTHVALASTNVQADHAALRERGVDVDETVMEMGDPVPPMFWFRDGDGNRFLIVQGG